MRPTTVSAVFTLILVAGCSSVTQPDAGRPPGGISPSPPVPSIYARVTPRDLSTGLGKTPRFVLDCDSKASCNRVLGTIQLRSKQGESIGLVYDQPTLLSSGPYSFETWGTDIVPAAELADGWHTLFWPDISERPGVNANALLPGLGAAIRFLPEDGLVLSRISYAREMPAERHLVYVGFSAYLEPMTEAEFSAAIQFRDGVTRQPINCQVRDGSLRPNIGTLEFVCAESLHARSFTVSFAPLQSTTGMPLVGLDGLPLEKVVISAAHMATYSDVFWPE